MKKLMILFLSLCLLSAPLTVTAQDEIPADETPADETPPDEAMTDEARKYMEWAQSFWSSLDIQRGTIKLPGGAATLEIPEQFYYLNPKDAERVLVEVWHNPPDTDTLGMIFPSEYTPFDDNGWAVTIQYEEDGYVSDKDAEEIKYDELLESMKKSVREDNGERVKNGYEAIELVGWAVPPYYDKQSRKLHWARELKFGDSDETNTLNYNIRVLGRKGVLVLNFVAGMDQLEEIRTSMNTVMGLANFNAGYRYEDFDPKLDKVAAYGIGALVAGKVMAKAGIFSVILVFLKKFGVLAVIGIGAFFKKIFGRKA